MSRKNTLQFTVASAQSLSASFTTTPNVITNLDNISYQIDVTTADSTGTFVVQASNDYKVVAPNETVVNAGTWVTLTLSGSPSVSAANDIISIALTQPPFTALRLSYTAGTAGTGTCNIYLNAKQVGG